eukprot:m.797863 g.797863  ORF g.797863 m.797863 type:complete len:1192 (-) comp23348_c0_seq1:286-3861(-)
MASKAPKPPRPSRPPPMRAVPTVSPTKPMTVVAGRSEPHQLSKSAGDGTTTDHSDAKRSSPVPVPRQGHSTFSGSRTPTTSRDSVAGTTYTTKPDKPDKPKQRPPTVYQPPWESTVSKAAAPSRIPQSTAARPTPKPSAPRPSVRPAVSPTSPPSSSVAPPPRKPSPPSKPQSIAVTRSPSAQQPTPTSRSIKPFSSKRAKPTNPYSKGAVNASPSPRFARKSSDQAKTGGNTTAVDERSSIPRPSSPTTKHIQTGYVNVRAPPPRKMNASVTSTSFTQGAPVAAPAQPSSGVAPKVQKESKGGTNDPQQKTPPQRAAATSPAPEPVSRLTAEHLQVSASPTPPRRSPASPLQRPSVAPKQKTPDATPVVASRDGAPSTHTSLPATTRAELDTSVRSTTTATSAPRYNITRPAPAAPSGSSVKEKTRPLPAAASVPSSPQRVAPHPPTAAPLREAQTLPSEQQQQVETRSPPKNHSNTSYLAGQDASLANTAGTVGNTNYESYSDDSSLGSEDQWSDSDDDADEEEWKQEVLQSGRTSVISATSRGSVEVEVDTSSPLPEKFENETDRKAAKRLQVVQEILKTEQTYVKGLKLLQELFFKMLCEGDKPVLSEELKDEIFLNSAELLAVHLGIVQRMENVMAAWCPLTGTIGDMFSSIAPYLKIYKHYAAHFDRAMLRVDELSKKNPAFISKLQKCHADSRVGFGLTFGAYLLEPIQRIPRYKLLLQEHLKNLPEGHPDIPMTEEALARIADVATDVNEGIRARENEDKVKELQGDFPKNFPIVQPGRVLKMQGQLGKVCRRGTQPRTFFLFSDCLVYAQNEGDKFITPRMLPLEGMRVAEIEGEVVGEKYCFELKSSKKSFIIGCPGVSEKLAWQKELNDTITAHEKAAGNGSGASVSNNSGADGSATGGVGTEAPMWIPDSGVSMCQLCTAEFTVWKRRHHCRLCGKVVCGTCSANNLPIRYKNNKLERVCDECFEQHAPTETEQQTGQAGRTMSRRMKPRKSSRQIRAGVLDTAAKGIKGDQEILFSGYLTHNKSATRKSSKRSWFVLKRDFALYKFRAPEDVAAVTSLPLPGNTVSVVAADRRGSASSWMFVIRHPHTKPMHLEADSEEQRDAWVKVLAAASVLETLDDKTPAVVDPESDPAGAEGAQGELAHNAEAMSPEATDGASSQSELLLRIEEIDADDDEGSD